MLTKEKAKELRLLIDAVREADDLANRFASGYTNYSGDEVRQSLNKANAELAQFINENTEE